MTFCVFTLLALLHIAEIAIFAAILYGLSDFAWPVQRAGPRPLGPDDFLYLAAINFTTLGFGQIDIAGPLRMVTMLRRSAASCC